MPNLSAERLQFLGQLNRDLTSIDDLECLVRFATERCRELFEAQGAAIIMLDAETNELYFPVVRDEDRFAQLRVGRTRFPADQGIAGWALKHDQSVLVTDTQSDPRFYSGVDRKSMMATQALLCSPLRASKGNVGVLEIVNPADRFLTQADLDFLDLVAADVTGAYLRAQSSQRSRGRFRGTLRWGGLLAAGLALGSLIMWLRTG